MVTVRSAAQSSAAAKPAIYRSYTYSIAKSILGNRLYKRAAMPRQTYARWRRGPHPACPWARRSTSQGQRAPAPCSGWLAAGPAELRNASSGCTTGSCAGLSRLRTGLRRVARRPRASRGTHRGKPRSRIRPASVVFQPPCRSGETILLIDAVNTPRPLYLFCMSSIRREKPPRAGPSTIRLGPRPRSLRHGQYTTRHRKCEGVRTRYLRRGRPAYAEDSATGPQAA